MHADFLAGGKNVDIHRETNSQLLDIDNDNDIRPLLIASTSDIRVIDKNVS